MAQDTTSRGAAGGRRYRLISADSHVNEPPDLWTARVPSGLQDRVPRIERFEQGDAWVIEGVKDPITFGMNACAGLDPSEQRGWVRFEEIRRGGYDPVVRLTEMDKDGVDAEVLYPTPRLSQGVAANQDPELHHLMVSAYNDWLSEYAGEAPARFAGSGHAPQPRGRRSAGRDRPSVGSAGDSGLPHDGLPQRHARAGGR